MRITVKRTYLKNCTPGDAAVLDDDNVPVFDFKTLELPWKNNERMVSCIPAGDYLVQKMPPTAKRKYEYFHVLNVPGRDSILWHPGNYTRQILGCTLPGEAHVDLDKDGITDITNTTATLKILTAMMPDKFKLTIE
jgi:hypothetical protein